MALRLPPLNALRAFEVASRLGSFTLAARELSVSQGAVSRHVARLEDHLGLQLFERSHREIRLTAAGQAYAQDVRQVFERLHQSTAAIKARQTRRQLRVVLFPSIASRWLMPRLGRFQEQHPDVELSLKTTSATVDLERDEADITNLREDPHRPAVAYRQLFEIVIQPVCCPSLLQGPGAIRSPADLDRFVLLQSMNRTDDWRIWLEHAGYPDVKPQKVLKFEHSSLAYQAAIDGIGVAISQNAFVQDEIAAGRLAAPFPLAVKTGEFYGVGWLRSRGDDPAIRAFLDWMSEEAERTALAISREPIAST